MINLRPYQIEALEAIDEAYQRGCMKQLIALPTGTGKTVLFAAQTLKMNDKTLILAHRGELLQQATDKIKMLCSEADIGILKAERDEISSQIVIASVQTACRPKRLAQLREQGFKLLIVDEAHHAAADSYKKIFEELGFNGTAGKLLLGVTATAKRGDGQALGKVFDEVVFERSIQTMIKAGYLSDVRGVRVQTKIDLSSVKTRAGDFVESQLAKLVNTAARNELIVNSYNKHTIGKKAIVFTVNVDHAKTLAEAFNKAGIPSAAVYGAMASEERRAVLEAFKMGELKVLTSCNVLTEGFDEPSIEAVFMARPTKSQSLYIQCIGRGLRLYTGKECCIVLDFSDSRQHVMQMATLAGKPLEGKLFSQVVKEVKTEREKEARQQGKLAEVIIEHFELLDKSVYRWIPMPGGHLKLILGNQEYILLQQVEIERYKVSLVNAENVKLLSSQLLTLSYAQGVAEDSARQLSRNVSMKTALWNKEQATFKQKTYLMGLGVKELPEAITRGEAADMIDRIKAEKDAIPATAKQLYKLKSLGVDLPTILNKHTAQKLIGMALEKAE
jgi:superfamily II DNA or RNA helicase